MMLSFYLQTASNFILTILGFPLIFGNSNDIIICIYILIE